MLSALLAWLLPAVTLVSLASPGDECSGDGATILADPREYYAIELVPTRKIPGLGRTSGRGYIAYDESPFGIAVTREGNYLYDLMIEVAHLPDREDGRYIAWITTPELDHVQRIGPLDDRSRAQASVTFNKFLVVVTLEQHEDLHGATLNSESPSAEGHAAGTETTKWSGPIVLRGMSRSGYMHTMAGHGPYSSEPCAKYGY